MQYWAKTEPFYIFDESGCYFVRKGCTLYMWNFEIFSFKTLFHKIQNLVAATLYLRNNYLILL